ncbi:hypothetical protein E0K89_000610 [Aquicoccus sp. SCR17]|nr:hypothetical protein [Carideicomes alvinocaridis]
MNRIGAICILVAATVLTVLLEGRQAEAQTHVVDFAGEAHLAGSEAGGKGANAGLGWKSELSLGLVGGAPTLSNRFTFDFYRGLATLPILGGEAPAFETVRIGSLPAELRDALRVTGARLRIVFDGGAHGEVHVELPAGATGRETEWTYNQPETRDWDRLFRTADDTWLTADAAQDLWESGPEVLKAELLDARLNQHDLHRRYAATFPRAGHDALLVALGRVRDGLTRSYGLEATIDPTGGDWSREWRGLWTRDWRRAERFGEPAQDWIDRHAAARDWLERMAALPPRFRTGRNHGPFEQALKDARAILAEIEVQRTDFVPPDPDPADQPAGRAPRFDLTPEQIAEAERLAAMEAQKAAEARSFESALRKLEGHEIRMAECGQPPALARGADRADIHSFDDEMKWHRLCLEQAEKAYWAARDDMDRRVDAIKALFGQVAPTQSEPWRQDRRSGIRSIEDRLAAELRAFRELHAAERAAHNSGRTWRNEYVRDLNRDIRQRNAEVRRQRREAFAAARRHNEAVRRELFRQGYISPAPTPSAPAPSRPSAPRTARNAAADPAPERVRGDFETYIAVADGVVRSPCDPYDVVRDGEEMLANCEDAGTETMLNVNWQPCRGGSGRVEFTEVIAFKVISVSGLTRRALEALEDLVDDDAYPPFEASYNYAVVRKNARDIIMETSRDGAGLPAKLSTLSELRALANDLGCDVVELVYNDGKATVVPR